MNNFILTNLDTDSISFCKQDFSKFTKDEDVLLLQKLNSLFPSEIRFAPDGDFEVFIVLKAKNYISYDGKKIKLKGSALKSSTLEPIFKTMLNEFIDALVFVIDDNERSKKLQDIYMKYVMMVHCITDIAPWCTKKTLSATTFASERKNESTIVDAITGSEYVEGDKVYLYRTLAETWKLREQFDGSYSWDAYYKKIFNTAQRFSIIMDTKALFPNYSLVRLQKELHEKIGVKNPKPEKEKKPKKKKENTLSGGEFFVSSDPESLQNTEL